MGNTKKFFGWWLLVGLFFCMMISVGLMSNSFSFFFQPVVNSLGFSMGSFSLVTTISALVAMVACIFVGKLITKVNINILSTVMAVVSIGAYIMYSQCSTLTQFYICGVFSGLGYAGYGTLLVSQVITNWFVEKRGLAMGIAMMGSGAGGAIFAPLNSWMIASFGWRNAFLFGGIIAAILVIPVTVFMLKLRPSDIGQTPYGQKALNSDEIVPNTVTEKGLTLKESIKTFAFWGLCITNLFMGAVNFGLQMHAPSFLQVAGFSGAMVALTISVSNIALLLGKVLCGTVNDKFGVKIGTAYVFIANILTCLILMITKTTATAFIFAIIWGIAGPAITVAVPLMLNESFGNKNFALIYSIVMVFQTFGFASGAPLVGFIYDATKNYNYSWMVLAIFSALGLIFGLASVIRGKKVMVKKFPGSINI